MEKLKLGDICKIVTGSTPKTSIAEYWDGNINWITPAELTEDTYIVNDSQRKITNRAIEETGLKSFPKGTVILTSRAPIGKVAIAGKEMYCNQGFKNLICSSKINNKYLYWYLKGHTEYLNSLGRGATFKEISKTIVENIEIPVPDLDTQKNCVDVLEKCNEIIKSYQKQLKSFDTLVKSRFIELFGDPVYNTKNNKKKTLEQIGKWASGGTPSRKNGSYFEGTIDWYSAGELNSLYLNNSIEKITEEAINCSSAKLFPARSMLVGMYDTAAFKMGILKKTSSCNQACACVIPNENINIIWLYYELYLMKEYFLSQRRGVRQKNLNLGMIKKFEIPVSKYEDQLIFADFVAHVDKSKLAVQKSLDELETLKKSLMQEYFG